VKYQVHCGFFSFLKKKNKTIVTHGRLSSLSSRNENLFKRSFAWFMYHADMSWISLQQGPEIRHPKKVRRKQPPEKSLLSLLDYPTLTPPSLSFVRIDIMCDTHKKGAISFS
jgi:hypothetical protein